MAMARSRLIVLAVGLVTGGWISARAASDAWVLATAKPCDGRGTSIVALTGPQVIHLCKENKSTQWFYYSAGWHGFRKSKAGDRKTPIGTYALLPARGSIEFGTFIAVGYPNAEDRAHNRTGDGIGIHGPRRGFAVLGPANLLVNWTAGCLAVATDRNIQRIARWLEENPKGRRLHVLADT
jgi:L,D-peptidoglycan transpeptidase YkuD (ErfK/YbiS/YcfS/YnhG family)